MGIGKAEVFSRPCPDKRAYGKMGLSYMGVYTYIPENKLLKYREVEIYAVSGGKR
jgi:hypothetical protein